MNINHFINSRKSECCGCSACYSVCPKSCITMQRDEEGFLYPFADESLCTDCGLCQKSCQVIHQFDARGIRSCIAVRNNNEEVRLNSSSGGLFTLIAEYVINSGGVVFGAAFDNNWLVSLDECDKINDLNRFRGSKYLQADVGETFCLVREKLKRGVSVLFTGTPCQISGLRHFLRREYSNLYLVDTICHGVPSPMVWQDFLKEYCSEKGFPLSKFTIKDIQFRDKTNGWTNYQLSITLRDNKTDAENKIVERFTDTPYAKGFLQDLILRPSCYQCPVKGGKSCSDLTLGDFWGIDQICHGLNDDKGTGIVLTHTDKGEKLLNQLNFWRKETSSNEVLKFNPSYVKSAQQHPRRDNFFNRYKRNKKHLITYLVNTLNPKPNLLMRVRHKIKTMFNY